MIVRRQLLGAAAVLAAARPAMAGAEAEAPEKPTLTLAVGGQSLVVYAPVTLAVRLGQFRRERLEVEIVNLAGGAKALQALIGGSADVTAGSFDHTIQMQAKHQAITGVVLFARYPGIVLAVRKALAGSYAGPQDLKGWKIGVTSPGSQTQFMVAHLMARAGLRPSDAAFIGVGGGPAAVAAVRRGEIDALANADPVITELVSAGDVTIVADTRTEAGTVAVFGAPYPSGTIYLPTGFIARNPRTVQAIANSMVRTLRWVAKATPEEMADALPPEWAAGDRATYVAALANSKAMFSPDGRFDSSGAQAAHDLLAAFDPAVAASSVDLGASFTNVFVDRALVAT